MPLNFPGFIDYEGTSHTFRAMNHVLCTDPLAKIQERNFDLNDEDDQQEMQKMFEQLREKYVISFTQESMELGPIMSKMESLKPNILLSTLQVFPKKGLHPANMIHIRVPLTYMETSICFAIEGVNLVTGEKTLLHNGEFPALIYILVLMDNVMYELKKMYIEKFKSE